MSDNLDPDDFVDLGNVFGEEYHPDEITHASFEVAPGHDVPAAALEYRRNNSMGPRGRRESREWSISMYGPSYNGSNIPISDEDARYILENMYGEDLAAVDWGAQHKAGFE